MAHLLIEQLRFTKQEWLRGHVGLSAEDAQKRLGHSNSISWMVAHLADFDQAIWIVQRGQRPPVSEAVTACAYGQPASVPSFDEMMAAWHAIQDEIVEIQEAVTADDLNRPHGTNRVPAHENLATLIWRQTWHYWYHLGEMQAIRQALGHENLAQFVGSIPATWIMGNNQ
ncbi:MAG: DinB family protein [Chloroflexota bacterium]